MYRDENKTLKETMRIMQESYNFFATVRMYKARFQQWGIEKKIKAEDAVEIFRQQTARAKAGKPSSVAYVRGRKINPDRLQRYRYRAAAVVSEQILRVERSSSSDDTSPEPISNHVVCRTPSPEPSASPSISPRLEDPVELKVPQECMQILGNYLSSSFERGEWQQAESDRAEVNDAFTWAHYLASSQGLIAHNRTKEGFSLLSICFDQYKTHLQSPDSFFWLATYKAAMVLEHRDRKLADTFINYASTLTSLLLPSSHPFNQVWSRIMMTGMSGLVQHASALFQSYLDTWRQHLTAVEADHTSIVQMGFVFIQLHCSGMISYAFLREMIDMMMGMLSSEVATQYLLQEAKFRMACLQLEKKKFTRSENIINEIISWINVQTDTEYMHLRVKCAWIMFEIQDKKGSNAEAMQAGYDLLHLCQEVYGNIHLQTLDAMSALEDFLRRSGNVPVTARLTADFESRWAVFAQMGRSRKGFPHDIERPWYHRCIELDEDPAYVQETIDLFERSSWLKESGKRATSSPT
ncbi:hypothetical protein F4809DRAFT_652401 [Biscogniauxia mediterranea]|nr:hypothetical protein F4809DRAFT_652401 [Biscogniauxia mediterranea]